MLVLTRNEQQTIRIGDDVVITVVKTGAKTRIGIEAPLNVRVLRGELEEREDERDAA